MIGQIPCFGDYVRQDGKVVGRCMDCGYQGPMDHGMTGYECARCKSMKLELELKDGSRYAQFVGEHT